MLTNAIPAPATRLTELELAFNEKLVAAIATGEEIVMVPPDAPTDTAPAPEMLKLLATVSVVEAAPRVLPAIVAEIVENATAVFEIVIVLRLLAKAMPAPATSDTLLEEAFNEKAAAAAGAEIEILEALFVMPISPPATSVIDPVEPLKLNLGLVFMIVTVERLDDRETPDPATRLTESLVPLSVKAGAEIETEEALLVIPIIPPTTSVTELELPLKLNPGRLFETLMVFPAVATTSPPAPVILTEPVIPFTLNGV